VAAATLDSPTGVAVASRTLPMSTLSLSTGHDGATSPTIEPLIVRRDGLDVWNGSSADVERGRVGEDGNCMMHYPYIRAWLHPITTTTKSRKRMWPASRRPCVRSVRIFGGGNERGYRGPIGDAL